MHFLRNGLDYLHRQGGDDCLIDLRWLYGRRDDAEARGDLAAWVLCWQEKYPKLSAWVEENIEAFACHQPGGSSSSPKLQRSLDIFHVKGAARKTKIL